jgi:hypothetical protein
LPLQNILCSFFVRPKKEPKKGRRKRQVQPVFTPATQSLIGASKQVELRAVSGSPSRLCLPNFLQVIKSLGLPFLKCSFTTGVLQFAPVFYLFFLCSSKEPRKALA